MYFKTYLKKNDRFVCKSMGMGNVKSVVVVFQGLPFVKQGMGG